ncbi:hypothetical protein SAMN05216455_10235 [Segatella bryantii]|jgi:hypothetical protein|uniref:hypothetical protein n=1 Tax=Segatella bryantii TaxID=77095 RepID=UPI0008984EF3|nr:hypothetical protein [Segatella bryantii]SDZ94959.1 hypothetical protein SAMN05216455_10235 [Segatella bryantii]
MQYYLIPAELAECLGLTSFRRGNTNGYVVTSGDLAPYGISEALADGAQPLTEDEAKEYIKNINKR